MAYVIYLPNKTYKTLNGEFTVTEERQKVENLTKIRFNITSTGLNQEKTTDLINEPIQDPITIIKKAMPSISDSLPLVEFSNKNYTCSAYLLKGGKQIRLYLPIADSIKRLEGLIERRDRIQLSDGEHVYTVHAKDIEAVIID